MDVKRWALAAALLLSGGMLANCSQIFGSKAAGGARTATVMPAGANGGAAVRISEKRTFSAQH